MKEQSVGAGTMKEVARESSNVRQRKTYTCQFSSTPATQSTNIGAETTQMSAVWKLDEL